MATLEDFVGQEPAKLEDFLAEPTTPPSSVPERALKSRAAYTALMSSNPEDLLVNYQRVLAESKEGQKYQYDKLVNDAVKIATPQDIKAMTNILTDPTMNDTQKQAILKAYQNGELNDPINITATQSAIADEPKSTVESDEVRMTVSDQFREVREYREFVQAQRNRKEIEIGRGSMGAFLTDFFETAITPFATNKVAAQQINSMAKALGKDDSRVVDFFLSGSAVASLRDALHSMPPQKRIEAAKQLVNMIESSNSVFIGENKVNALNQINAVIGGDYSTFDKIVDNATVVLDLVGLGGMARSAFRKGAKALSKEKPIADRVLEGEYIPAEVAKEEVRKSNLRAIADTTSPVSPARLLGEVNSTQSKQMYDTVAQTSGDEAAEALYGTSRDEALHSQANPQPNVADGSVDVKAHNIGLEAEVNKAIVKEAEEYGNIWYSDREKSAAKAQVEIDLQTLSGARIIDNMSTVAADDAKVSVNATFGHTKGGFLHADHALRQVAFALREYGVDPKDLQLLKREAGEYVPVDFNDVKDIKGDYLVQWKSGVDYRPEKMGDLDKTKVRLNFFDSFTSLRSKRAGTVARWLVDASSMLDRLYGGAAAVQADKAVRLDKMLLAQHAKFSDVFVKLPKARQEKLYEHIKEANQMGLELSDNDLIARGFVAPEIQALKDWRKAWNTHWYLESQDLAKTLRNQGYQVLDNGQDKFFGKAIAKNRNIDQVYDPTAGSVVRINASSMDNLYNTGGTLVALRRPVTIGGKEVSHMMVRNTPSEYMRGIRDLEVLNYRKGYFHTAYKAPKYIVETVRDAKGNELYQKAVEMADSVEEAEHVRQRLAAQHGRPVEDWTVRGDKADGRPDMDFYWDMQAVTGRVAQRHRGQPLADANAAGGAFNSKFILDPVESAIRASRSLSGRVAQRDMLEAMKARTVAQWGKLFPKDEFGRPKWPDDSNALIKEGQMHDKDIRDARTAVEYVNYLQHGYTNAVDDTFKTAVNMLADYLGRAKMGTAEKIVRTVDDVAPADSIKGAVYHAFIGTHFIRQFLVQSHQSVRTMAINPSYAFSGSMAKELSEVVPFLMGVADVSKASPKAKELIDFIEKSGALDAIDRSNLIRGSLTDMAESRNVFARTIGKGLAIPRKVGFDTGEAVNMITHLLATRDLAVKAGKNLKSKAVLDEIYSQSRALTYDMNIAGDMPYNQNWASMVMQFFQVPHKAWLQYTNRRIPTDVKLRLATLDTVLWGVPGAAIVGSLASDMLPEDPAARETLMFGAESALYNAALSKMVGKETNIDFSSFSPYGTDGFARLGIALATQDFGPMIAKMPALAVGNRVAEATQRMARYFGWIDEDVGLDKEEAMDVVHGALSVMSAYDHARKAYLIHQLGEIRDKSTGKRLVEDASWAHAVAQIAGFKSQEEVLGWAFNEERNKLSKNFSKNVEEDYKYYFKILVRDGAMANTDPELPGKILGIMSKKWKDDPDAAALVNQWLKRDIVAHKDQIVNGMLKYGRIPDTDTTDAALDNMKLLKDPKYDSAAKWVDDYRKYIKEFNEQKEEK